VPDVVDHGFNGLLVPPRDAQAVTHSLARLLEHPALAREMGRAARATIASRFSPEVAVEKLGRIYGQLDVSNDPGRETARPAMPSPFFPGSPLAGRRFQESP
jgi:glycosyltransferase involved in cell wall biosynthesis